MPLLVGGFFPVWGSERSGYRWGTAGFTLIELLNVIAIIGILSGVGINTFSGYKVRAYDAHSKQALRDMHFLCNAFWIDTYPSQECDLPTIKDPIYAFNQNPDVAANLPPSPYDTFCATAKHSESPNTFTINNSAVISQGPSCGGSADTMLTAYVCSGSFNDPCPTSACDEECTKQKAKDRLQALLAALPDLMQPTPEEIANTIQGIQNREYTDDPGETPTLQAEGMVDELLAAAEPPPEEPPPPTKAELTETKFEDNCAVIRETAKQCGSQTTPISHVDDEGRTWSMNCPVKDAHEARAYYYRLMAENAVYGGADSNPYYQKEEGPGHQPHNKTCCYGLHDGFQPESSSYGFQASTRENFSKEKYSGTCGLQPTAGKSGSLSMLCNMGQTGGETQFRSCDVNVMPPPPAQAFSYQYQPPEIACRQEYQGQGPVGHRTIGYWMKVDTQGNQLPGSRASGFGNPCNREVWNECGPVGASLKCNSEQSREADQNEITVFVSPPPADGWSSAPTSIGGRSSINGVEQPPLPCRCQQDGSGCCTFDFNTETYLDEDGNRWDPTEFNKRVE